MSVVGDGMLRLLVAAAAAAALRAVVVVGAAGWRVGMGSVEELA